MENQNLNELVSSIKEYGEQVKNIQKALDGYQKDSVEYKNTAEALNKNADELAGLQKMYKEQEAIAKAQNEEIEVLKRQIASNEKVGDDDDNSANFFKAMCLKGLEQSAEANELLTKSYSAGVMQDGGFLVPQATAQVIKTRIFQRSPISGLINNVNITVGDNYPILRDEDDVGVDYGTEKSIADETDQAELGKQTIDLHFMDARPRATETLLQDAPAFQQWLTNKISDKLARQESADFHNGNGVKTAKGFLTYASGTNINGQIEQVASGTNGSIGSADKVIDLIYSLKSEYRARATILTHNAVLKELRKIKDNQGRYLWDGGNLSEGRPATFDGIPVIEDPDMPTPVAGSLSMAIADWKEAYTSIRKGGVVVKPDPYTVKPKIEFYTRQRIGGDVVNFEAIKLLRFGA